MRLVDLPISLEYWKLLILNLFINVVFGSNRTKNTLSAIELNESSFGENKTASANVCL